MSNMSVAIASPPKAPVLRPLPAPELDLDELFELETFELPPAELSLHELPPKLVLQHPKPVLLPAASPILSILTASAPEAPRLRPSPPAAPRLRPSPYPVAVMPEFALPDAMDLDFELEGVVDDNFVLDFDKQSELTLRSEMTDTNPKVDSLAAYGMSPAKLVFDKDYHSPRNETLVDIDQGKGTPCSTSSVSTGLSSPELW
eukprot:TRINITY_DN19218_c0_g1_i1.p1 TRINITY_DN19218_c0_g1~~TRINITY_DN19218_c0_g1_i1.p1  ORF type:complete len:202 (-),score=43.68 TRINITY_DN19218_c0_g1_i1:192-797(-)